MYSPSLKAILLHQKYAKTLLQNVATRVRWSSRRRNCFLKSTFRNGYFSNERKKKEFGGLHQLWTRKRKENFIRKAETNKLWSNKMSSYTKMTRHYLAKGALCESWSVRPDLAKFHHFGKNLKIFGIIFKVYLVFGKVSNPLWHNFYALGQIFFAVPKWPNIKKQSGHPVTLVLMEV